MTFRYVTWDMIPAYEQLGWMFSYPVSDWACAMAWPCACAPVTPSQPEQK